MPIGGEGGGNDPAHLGNGDGAPTVDVSKEDKPFEHISHGGVDGSEELLVCFCGVLNPYTA